MTASEYDPFPAGKLQIPADLTPATLAPLIDEIAEFPAKLRSVVEILSESTLDEKTLPGVWTIRQVTHHLADSHINSLIRFKMALTTDRPVICPYPEGAWAETPDAKSAPVELSLSLLENLHARWVFLLRSLTEADMQRPYYHPEEQKEYPVGLAIALYAWHGRHHLAFIQAALEK